MSHDTAVGTAAPSSVRVHETLLRLIRADITALEAEAIVFYARPDLALGSGFGNAIARRGGPSIKKELDALGSVPTTEAVVTGGGHLKAKSIVHAVGPVFQEEDLERKLHATILHALSRAEECGITQLALPPMGAGFYGVPLATSVDITVSAVTEHVAGSTRLREVILCANDGREYRALEARLAGAARAAGHGGAA